MLIVQTYLGQVPGGAHCFVYYLYGAGGHDRFSAEIEPALARLGDAFGSRIHLFGPHGASAQRISREITDKYGELWWDVMKRCPGLLVLREPFSDFDPARDEGLFISLSKKPKETLLEVERILIEQDQAEFAKRDLFTPPPTIFDLLRKHVEVSINVGPISVKFR
jgi:hypothetical protein